MNENGGTPVSGEAASADAAPHRERFGIAGIGASAGGLSALNGLFSAMPADTGLAFVVIQHLAPERTSHMGEIIGRRTSIKITDAAEGVAPEPDTIYMAPPGHYLTLTDGRFHLSEPEPGESVRMPIDTFFSSLAEDKRDMAAGVILSGTGSDGVHGVEAIHRTGGLVMAQDPATAEFDAMPRNAIASGSVDRVLPVEKMGGELAAFAHGAPASAGEETFADLDDEALRRVLDVLHEITGSDYRHYKSGTVGRRIARRMDMLRIEKVSDYLAHLRAHNDEAERLSKDMLIGVTSWFRDAEAFEALRKQVIAPLADSAGPERPIRVWVPGCATGEEAYSIAILIEEELAAREKNGRVQVQLFASDVDEEALRSARSGVYPSSMVGDVSPERLKRYFTQVNNGYQITKEIRDLVIFSVHNAFNDPPFARLDLVSCRNLLIYLELELQDRLLGITAFALVQGGCLFLGKSEGLARSGTWFDVADEKWRIYRRNEAPMTVGSFPMAYVRQKGFPPAKPIPPRPTASLGEIARGAVLEELGAAVAVIDLQGRVLYLDGQARDFLDLPLGESPPDLFRMVKAHVAAKLRSTVRQSAATGEAVKLERVRMRPAEDVSATDIVIRPTGGRGGDIQRLAILFRKAAETAQEPEARIAPPSPDESQLIEQLEAEVRQIGEDLRSTVEEHEASSQDLRAANEEMMAMNEELQAANEELESSREEIQSVNEELNSVNAELSERLRELTAANNDLANLMFATDAAVVFLDPSLRIMRFTPPTIGLLHLIPADVGRPVGDISLTFGGVDLVTESANVLKSLAPYEDEVPSKDGEWSTLRILPYRTLDDRIAGVVISVTNVTRLKRSEEAAEAARAYAESIVETVREPLVVLDKELRVVSANKAFYAEFEADPGETSGRYFLDMGARGWDVAILRDLFEKILPERSTIDDFSIERDSGDHGRRTLLLNARRIEQPHPLILIAMEDVTDRQRAEAELKQSRDELERLVSSRTAELVEANKRLQDEIAKLRRAEDALNRTEDRLELAIFGAGLGTFEVDLLTHDAAYDERCAEMLGYSPGAIAPRYEAWQELIHPDDSPGVVRAMREHFVGRRDFFDAEVRMRAQDGEWRWILIRGRITSRDEQDRPKRLSGTHLDVTERRHAEMALRATEEQLRQAQKLESIGRLSGGIAHDFNNLMQVVTGYATRFKKKPCNESSHEKYGKAILEAGERATALTRQLLAFGRKAVLQAETFSLNETVRRLEPMLAQLRGADVSVSAELRDDLWPVMADRNQLDQVLLNLAINARDAMPEGGVLTIRTANVTPELRTELEDSALPKRDFVMLSVTDTGTGMDETAMSRLFEPFFTTKAPGQGTGLGLSTAYGIIRQSGGDVLVRSAPRQGSTFSVYLPRLGTAEAADGPRTGAASGQEVRGGGETILLIEDEAGVRALTALELSEYGYKVIEAADSDSALSVEQKHKGVIDLVLADVVLPGMSGPQVFRELARTRPGMKALFMSGYAEGQVVHEGVIDTGVSFIGKPFSSEDLARRVREVLDSEGSAEAQR